MPKRSEMLSINAAVEGAGLSHLVAQITDARRDIFAQDVSLYPDIQATGSVARVLGLSSDMLCRKHTLEVHSRSFRTEIQYVSTRLLARSLGMLAATRKQSEDAHGKRTLDLAYCVGN